MRRRVAWPLALASLAAPTVATAATPIATGAANGADTVWIMVSSALVLLMCMPGLGLFYGGLVRTKNFLSVLVQIGAIAAMASLLWLVCGYALAFGPVGHGLIGGLDRSCWATSPRSVPGWRCRKAPLPCSRCALPRSPRR
jgi:Amt family ammonium transporter